MKFLTAIALICVLIISGCSKEPPLTSGVVVSKTHHPEKKWVQLMHIPRTTRVGNSSVISYTSIPMFRRRPEHWVLVISGTVEIEGVPHIRQRELRVPSEVYDQVVIGSLYVVQTGDNAQLVLEKRRATREEKSSYKVESADPR